MITLPRLAKLPAAALLAMALVLTPGCKSSNNQWSFSVSRSVYGSKGGGAAHVKYPLNCSGRNDGAAAAVVVLLLLPVVIDIIILPVTLTHDLCN